MMILSIFYIFPNLDLGNIDIIDFTINFNYKLNLFHDGEEIRDYKKYAWNIKFSFNLSLIIMNLILVKS